ncbi:MAG: hypothetical protein IKD86_04470 [Firmicutes bacterium]|nr:hypothetical protein [Bacillota bacterium]
MADRLKRHFKKYADEYVFLELMPDYVKKEHIDFMRGVPIPVRHKVVLELADGNSGIDFKYFTMGMVNMLGIDPEFEYASKYAMFLKYMNPHIADIIVDVGIGLAQTRHLDEACISFRAALRIDPDNLDALYNFVLVCRELYGKSDRADYTADFKEEVFETLLHMKEVAPAFDKTYYYLGFAYINAGRYAMAEHEWREFLSRCGSCPERIEIESRLEGMDDAIRIERAYSDVISGNWEKGLGVLEEYKNTDMMEWWPLSYYLGVGYNRLGRNEEALEMLKIAVKKNPSSPEICAELVLTNQALGDEVNAEKYRRKLEIFNRPPDTD